MRQHRALPAAVLLACLFGTAGPRAQEPAPAGDEPRPSSLTEEVTVRLIQVPILAKNRNGEPITDLTAEEIRVKDRGEKMKVAFLEPLAREEAADPLPPTRLFIDAPGGWEAVSESTDYEPRYVTILVDMEHDPGLRRDEAMEDTIRFVRERMVPGTRIAVFTYVGEVHQELLFSSDPDAVASAIRSAYGRMGRADVDMRGRVRELVRQMQDCVSETGAFVNTASEACVEDVAMLYADERKPRTADFYEALDGMIRVLGGLQGRKVVFAISHGVASDPTAEVAEALRAAIGNTEQVANLVQYLGFSEGARMEMDRVIDVALREGVTIHFMDRMPAPTWDTGANQMEAFRPGARPAYAAYTAAQMDLEEIAVNTGGSFVADTHVFEGLSYAMDLEAGAYLLGYYTDHYLSAKQMRKVKISTARRGVRISHRRGSYDLPTVSDVVGKFRVGEIKPPKPAAEGEKRAPGNSFIPFQVVADPRGLGYETVGNGVHASFTVHIQIQDAKSRVVADGFRFLNHAYPLGAWESGEIEPIVINGWAELPPGRYSLHAEIHNPVNGHRGELLQILEVPAEAPAAAPDVTPAAAPPSEE